MLLKGLVMLRIAVQSLADMHCAVLAWLCDHVRLSLVLTLKEQHTSSCIDITSVTLITAACSVVAVLLVSELLSHYCS